MITQWLFITALFADIGRYPYAGPFFANSINYFFKEERADKKDLVLQVALDETFSIEQKAVLENSLRIFLARATSPHIIQCALRSSYKNRPISLLHFMRQWEDALSASIVQDIEVPAFVFIANYWGDDQSVGQGYVNLFYDTDIPFPGFNYRHYFHFAINSDYLAKQDNYVYAHDFDYWAGVIAHEMLHNLGYVHPQGVLGTFIYAFGKCLENNGRASMAPEGNTINLQVLQADQIYKL